MKFKKFSLLVLAGVACLTSCNGDETVSSSLSSSSSTSSISSSTSTGTQRTLEDGLNDLQKGFKAVGTLKSVTKYYTNAASDIPADIEDASETYSYTLTYQNSDDYVGVDRWYYIGSGEDATYYHSENAYEYEDGSIGYNYLDFDNVVKNDGTNYDDLGNFTPYGASGYINPFTLMHSEDFTLNGVTYSLSHLASYLLYSNMFSALEDIYSDVVFNSSELSFDDNYNLTNVKLVSDPYSGVDSINYTNYYTKTIYTVEFAVSDIATSVTSNLIVAEPDKPENEALKTALSNAAYAPSLTVRRHLVAYSGEDKAQQEECVDLYYDGTNIYNQVYDYVMTQGQIPSEPSGSDVVLIPSSSNDNAPMRVYVYSDGSWVPDGGSYNSINMKYSYDAFLPNFFVPQYDAEGNVVSQSVLSEDLFELAEDEEGKECYVPIEENVAYLGASFFVPFMSAEVHVASNDANSVRIYLTDDKKNLSEVVFTYDYNGDRGTVTYTYENVGSTVIPENLYSGN